MAEVEGLILEAGNGWAIVLLPGGEYKRIRTGEHLEVGQLYRIKKYSPVKYVAVAAIFLIVMVASLDFCRVTAYAHISPGINLGLNRWDRVVSVNTSNPGGQDVVEDLSLRGKSLEQVVNVIVQQQAGKTSISAEAKSEISVSLSVKDQRDKSRQEKLFSKVNATLNHNMKELDNRAGKVKVIRKGNQLIVVDDKQSVGPGNSNQAKPENSEKKQGSNGKPDKAKPEKELKQELTNHPMPARQQGNEKNEYKQGDPPGKKMNQEKLEQKLSAPVDNDKKIKNKDTGNNGKGIGSGKDSRPEKEKDKDKENKKSKKDKE